MPTNCPFFALSLPLLSILSKQYSESVLMRVKNLLIFALILSLSIIISSLLPVLPAQAHNNRLMAPKLPTPEVKHLPELPGHEIHDVPTAAPLNRPITIAARSRAQLIAM